MAPTKKPLKTLTSWLINSQALTTYSVLDCQKLDIGAQSTSIRINLELWGFSFKMTALWPEIITIIKNNQSFVITSHTNPDCDALGSELALAEHLRNLGKEVIIINSDPPPAAYRFLDSGSPKAIRRYSQAKH